MKAIITGLTMALTIFPAIGRPNELPVVTPKDKMIAERLERSHKICLLGFQDKGAERDAMIVEAKIFMQNYHRRSLGDVLIKFNYCGRVID